MLAARSLFVDPIDESDEQLYDGYPGPDEL